MSDSESTFAWKAYRLTKYDQSRSELFQTKDAAKEYIEEKYDPDDDAEWKNTTTEFSHEIRMIPLSSGEEGRVVRTPIYPSADDAL